MKNEKLIKTEKKSNKRKHVYKINPLMIPIETLEFFLDYFGTIKSRHETELTIPMHKRLSKIIRRLRYFGFIPFTIEEIFFEEEEEEEKKKEEEEDDGLFL